MSARLCEVIGWGAVVLLCGLAVAAAVTWGWELAIAPGLGAVALTGMRLQR